MLDLAHAADQAKIELGASADSLALLNRTAELLADRARLQTPDSSLTSASEDENQIAQLEKRLKASHAAHVETTKRLGEANERIGALVVQRDELRDSIRHLVEALEQRGETSAVLGQVVLRAQAAGRVLVEQLLRGVR